MTATKTDIFANYGDDARAALDAWANLDPQGFGAWSERAVERLYLSDFRRWFRSQTIEVAKTVPSTGQPPLFDAPAKVKSIKVRAGIVHDGQTLDLLTLSGHDGARQLREAMLRDIGPASTTVDRCRYGLALAERIDAETDRTGRPVTVAEVIAMEQAA